MTEIPVDNNQIPAQDEMWVRRSAQTKHRPESYTPTMHGKTYVTSERKIQRPDSYLSPDYILVAHHIMRQLSMKAGLKRWKVLAEQAVAKELHQFHFCN